MPLAASVGKRPDKYFDSFRSHPRNRAVWSRNGRELFFRNPDNRIMVIAYTVKDGSFVEDKPHLRSD